MQISQVASPMSSVVERIVPVAMAESETATAGPRRRSAPMVRIGGPRALARFGLREASNSGC